MINYGVVYPQAILVFVITIIYSVIQPLVLIFGAIYFGVAYVVYKYKLLFGENCRFNCYLDVHLPCTQSSFLQTIRVTWSGMADHFQQASLGCCPLSNFHDRNLRLEEKGFVLHSYAPTHRFHTLLGVVG
jgi:hypothetical protein